MQCQLARSEGISIVAIELLLTDINFELWTLSHRRGCSSVQQCSLWYSRIKAFPLTCDRNGDAGLRYCASNLTKISFNLPSYSCMAVEQEGSARLELSQMGSEVSII